MNKSYQGIHLVSEKVSEKMQENAAFIIYTLAL